MLVIPAYLILGPHGGYGVVGVHDHVHEGVEHAPPAGVAAAEPAHARPARQRKDTVVDHVEEAATVTRPSGSYWCDQDYTGGPFRTV